MDSGNVTSNKMERFNGGGRDRERFMRSLKSVETPILKRMQVYHNYVRPNSTLDGKTPTEASGIIVKGENKWLTIIQYSKQFETKELPPKTRLEDYI